MLYAMQSVSACVATGWWYKGKINAPTWNFTVQNKQIESRIDGVGGGLIAVEVPWHQSELRNLCLIWTAFIAYEAIQALNGCQGAFYTSLSGVKTLSSFLHAELRRHVQGFKGMCYSLRREDKMQLWFIWKIAPLE